jgi:hypothetical protein
MTRRIGRALSILGARTAANGRDHRALTLMER